MPGRIWRFPGCEFDELRRELIVDGVPVDVEVKPLDVLHQLLLHAGEVVTKEELLDAVWPGVVVVEASLATAVSKLRRALGPHADAIVTVPRIGYRLGVIVHCQAVATPPWQAPLLVAGQPVPLRDSWRLVRRLDRGRVGEVWLAEHPKTREQRVFKFALDEPSSRALRREVTLARLLRETLGERPDFVRLLEWNFTTQPHFIESEFAGQDLAAWVESQGGISAIPLARRLALLADVARAVHAAHGLDILHKDLKPGNILVSTAPQGAIQVRIGDFGAASLLAPSRLASLGITRLGFTHSFQPGDAAISGTMLYMAPEALAGNSPTAASDVYALGVLLYQLVTGDFRKPLTAGWEQDIHDELLREDIALAADVDPSRRLQSAGVLAERLDTLEERRARRAARLHETAMNRPQPPRPARRAALYAVAAAGAIGIAAVAVQVLSRPHGVAHAPAATQALPAVAVLPLQNLGEDTAHDYLRTALADEAATILSQTHGVAVRPFATTRQYADTANLALLGRELGVDSVLTGHFREADGRLAIALEAVDARNGKLLWRDSFWTPAASMVAAQVQLALRIRDGLAPALGGAADGVASEPGDEKAYALFLRSTELATDAAPNRTAIDLLRQSVAQDDGYAPAWHALSKRYYIEARYGSGDSTLMHESTVAAERAVALQPDYVAPAAGLVVNQVERGEVAAAWQRASDLVRRRPDSMDAQYAMSYVMRYAGQLDAAASHCEKAFLLDPRNHTSGLRSCAVVFLLRGDSVRALNYLHLDEGSDFERALTLHLLVAKGQLAAAARMDPSLIPQWGGFRLLHACVSQQPRAVTDGLKAAVVVSDDAETNYFAAAHLAWCGFTGDARELLARAVAGGYCGYPAMRSDPLLAAVRSMTGYAAIEAAARACAGSFSAATLKRG